MKIQDNTMALFAVFFALLSCSPDNNYCNELQLIIDDWTSSNPRIKNDYSCNVSSKVLELIFKEKSTIGSPIIEQISSNNLIFLLANSANLDGLDTVKVVFDLPKDIAVYGSKKSKVYTSYAYAKNDINRLLEAFEHSELLRKVSNHITFSMSNLAENEMLQSANLASEVFSWYNFGSKSGLEIAYNYALLKSTNSAIDNKIYELSICGTYAIAQEANVSKLSEIDALIGLMEFDLESNSIYEIDSIAKHLLVPLAPND